MKRLLLLLGVVTGLWMATQLAKLAVTLRALAG